MPATFLYPYGPLLLLLHAICALVLCGTSVHQAAIAIAALRGRFLVRLARVHGVLVLCAYAGTALFGALLYPRYRYFVRALYLDRYAPWASNLFDLKENLATLGLPLAIGAFVLSRDLPEHRDRRDRQALRIYAVMAVGTALLSLWNAASGLLCTSVRGIG